MTVAEIDAKMAKLNKKRDALKDELRELAERRDTLIVEEEAAAKAAKMTDTERAALARALAQSVSPNGVESGEVFGTP